MNSTQYTLSSEVDLIVVAMTIIIIIIMASNFLSSLSIINNDSLSVSNKLLKGRAFQ